MDVTIFLDRSKKTARKIWDCPFRGKSLFAIRDFDAKSVSSHSSQLATLSLQSAAFTQQSANATTAVNPYQGCQWRAIERFSERSAHRLRLFLSCAGKDSVELLSPTSIS